MTRRFLSLSPEERKALLDAKQSRFLENLARELDSLGSAPPPTTNSFSLKRGRPLLPPQNGNQEMTAMTCHADNVGNFARLCALAVQFETELLTERLIASKHLPPRNEGEGYLEWFAGFSRDQLLLMKTRLEAAGLKNSAMWGFAVGHLRMRDLPEGKARSNSGLT